MKRFETLEQSVLVRFSKKTGKIDTTLEGIGNAMMKLWALQNTPKTKECLIFSKVSGDVIAHCVGDESGFPKFFDGNKDDLGNIEDYCEGLLEAVN